MARKAKGKRPGRPELPKTERREAYSARLLPALIERAERRRKEMRLKRAEMVDRALTEWLDKNMRYEIHAIADENCSSIHEDVLEAAETVAAAKQAAERHSTHDFGAAILDTKTGLVDYGAGFGKPAPAPVRD